MYSDFLKNYNLAWVIFTEVCKQHKNTNESIKTFVLISDFTLMGQIHCSQKRECTEIPWNDSSLRTTVVIELLIHIITLVSYFLTDLEGFHLSVRYISCYLVQKNHAQFFC